MNAIGLNSGLSTGEGNCLAAHRIESHRREGDRGLLSGGEEHVHLALGRFVFAGDFVGEFDEPIRNAGHRRNDGDDLIPILLGFKDSARHVENALRRSHRGAAIFLDDQTQGSVVSW